MNSNTARALAPVLSSALSLAVFLEQARVTGTNLLVINDTNAKLWSRPAEGNSPASYFVERSDGTTIEPPTPGSLIVAGPEGYSVFVCEHDPEALTPEMVEAMDKVLAADPDIADEELWLAIKDAR